MSAFKIFLTIALAALVLSLAIISIAERNKRNECFKNSDKIVESFNQVLLAQQQVLNTSLTECKLQNQCLTITKIETITGVPDIAVACKTCQ